MLPFSTINAIGEQIISNTNHDRNCVQLQKMTWFILAQT